MKRTFLSSLSLLLLLSFTGLSQTLEEKQIITKDYNKIELERLANIFQQTAINEKEEALRLAKLNDWPVRYEEDGKVFELMKVSEEGNPLYYTTHNVNAARSTRANTMHSGGILGLTVNGENMEAHVWDAGLARSSHQEYDGPGGNNRFSIGDGTSYLHWHSAHVTGTIIAYGQVSSAKGMAPQADAVGYEWNNDLSEATSAANGGMLLSNHSYGWDATSIPDWYFGAYIYESRNWDVTMFNAPYYLMVVSAGNDGNDNTANGNPLNGNSSYDKLSGQATAKNNMVVANANDANINSNGDLVSVSINSSSSEGPTDDYRIKPDITGNGTELYSTFEGYNSEYGYLTGTSMSAPNVTGTLLLLQQHYNELNSNYMRAATLKGLALHTADDAGPSGPDAIWGWGLLNAKAAANIITNEGSGTKIEELTLSQGNSYSIDVTSDGINNLVVSISWTDPPGTANTGSANNTTPRLVNDLDVTVTKGGTTYYPYKLTSITTNGTGDNDVDPFEKVIISGASGTYTINVSHEGSLSYGYQNYSLIVSGISENVPPTANFEADNTAPGIGQTVNFTDLSSDNPTSWSWSFSPSTITYVGGTNSSSQNPQVQFNAEGSYNVTLIASNTYGSDSETKNNYIDVSFYCAASGASTFLEIIGVELGDINNTSGQNYYSDYTYLSTDLAKNQSYDITITNGDSYASADVGVWIDWNQDGIFNNSEEQVVCEIDDFGEGTFNFTVPSSADLGQTRMRVRTKYNGSDCGDPCGTTTYGEVEDYSVNIILGVDTPVADFEADNTNPGIGETVLFTDLSTNSPDTWSWSFTPSTVTYLGGTNSSSQNPQVQFNNPGTYTVELMVSNAGGSDSEIKTDYIEVVYPPVANFEADNLNPGIGQTVSFTDLSTNNPDTWSWAITPSTYTFVGGTNSSDQNPQVQFDAGGLYTIELMVSNVSGNDSEVKTDYIDVVFAPVADFIADDLNPGIGEAVNFTDLSTNNPDTWSWAITPSTYTFVGGSTSSDQNPQVQFDAGGLYTVELTVTNISGSDTETKTGYIDVIFAPIAEFEADNLTPAIGELVNFFDLSEHDPAAWLWTITPPTVTFTGGTSNIDQNPQVQFDAEGLYTIELMVTNISGFDTEVKTNYINVSIHVLELDVKVNLEGPYNGVDMNTELLSSMPLEQPYNVSPWNYSGDESVVAMPGTDIVDWILVEIRDAASAGTALASTSIGKQAAFLRSDGQVVDLNGNPLIAFETAIAEGLYIVIHHRNHLSIMSSQNLTDAGGLYSYDFTTDVTKAYQSGQKTMTGGTASMRGGNGFADDYEINTTDILLMWQGETGRHGYHSGDFNLDNQINNRDKNDVWIQNIGESSQVPD